LVRTPRGATAQHGIDSRALKATVAGKALRRKVFALRPAEGAERINPYLAKIPFLPKPPIGLTALDQRIKVDHPAFSIGERDL
jgi:hypothetical protein